MDLELRVLLRNYLQEPTSENAERFARSAARVSDTEDEGPVRLKKIWILSLITHLTDNGIAPTSREAMNELTDFLYGEQVASRYRKTLYYDVDGYTYFDPADFTRFLIKLNYRCDPAWEIDCDEDHGQCEVIGCPCPAGCLTYQHYENDYNVCFHHLKILENSAILDFNVAWQPHSE